MQKYIGKENDMVDIADWLKEEKQIGSYHLEKELSNSAMSVIYLANDFKQEFRQVVLKCLKTQLNKYAQQVFLYEARWLLLARTQHKHILRMFDIGVKDDFPYVVVEYAPHGSLRDLLLQHSGHPFSWDKVKRILQQVGSALSVAYTDMYMCHGDLKPERILFNDAGEALIGYFYMGRVHEFSSTTPDIIPAWTFPYASLERFEGPSSEDDQHALGCIAYEMCTGYQPGVTPGEPSPATHLQEHSKASFLESYHNMLVKQPVPPRSFNPEIPIESERAILKAMALKKEDRYPSVAAFLEVVLSENSKGETNPEQM